MSVIKSKSASETEKTGAALGAALPYGAVVALFCAALTVAISVYYSWASDYQPQGRYVITAAPLLFAIIAYGINGLLGAIPHVGDKLKRYAAYLAVAGVLVFDIYAFVNCLRAFVYV